MFDTSAFQFGLSEVILLFAILQTLLLVAVLLAGPGRTPLPSRLLALLLILLALGLAEFVCASAGILQRNPHWIGFSLPVWFCLAPLYYFYTRTLVGEALHGKDALHLLPLLLALLLNLPFYLADAHHKQELLSQLTGEGFPTFPLLAVTLLSLASFQTIAYFYLAYDFLDNYGARARQETANASLLAIEWLKKLSVAFCVFVVVFYLAAAELFFFYKYRAGLLSPYILAWGLAGFVFLVSWHMYRRPELFALYTPGALPRLAPVAAVDSKIKYEKTQLSEAQLADYAERLQRCMSERKPWQDGELRLADLADMLNMPAHHLSQLINVTQDLNFFDFINRQRVQHAVSLLAATGAQANMLDIALASGFNSKASFNRVFKKETGQTPSDCLKRLINKDNLQGETTQP